MKVKGAMIYRKNILLAIVEIFGGELNATDFQKLLFIFSENQLERKFDFVPYKFGCFSFQSMADKNKLINEGYLKSTKSWKLASNNFKFKSKLNEPDRELLIKSMGAAADEQGKEDERACVFHCAAVLQNNDHSSLSPRINYYALFGGILRAKKGGEPQ